MKFFNYDSPFWSFMSRIADLVIVNILWLVFCIPVFTIGASTAAMYRVTLNLVRGEGGGVVRSIKNTLKNAILLSIGNLPYSLVMAALNLSAPLLLLFATSFFLRTCIFWILIGGSLVAMLNSYLLRKIFKKYFELD